MAKTGTKPQPTKLKRLRGNPGGRPLNEREPQPKGKAKKPRGLTRSNPQLSKQWDRFGKPLEDLGLLTNLDAGAFRLMIQHYQFALEAAAIVNAEGMMIEGHRGVRAKNPAMQLFKDNSNSFRRFAEQFGMMPSARTRLETDPMEPLDSLADILFAAVDDDA